MAVDSDGSAGERGARGEDRPTEAIDARSTAPAAADPGAAGSSSRDSAGGPGEILQLVLGAGDVLAGRFELVRFLAHGGMGEVWEAVDRELSGERVALKTIRPGIVRDAWAMTSFRREIQLGKRVSHPNVCRIHDLVLHQPGNPLHAGGPRAELVLLTMELLEGETLERRIERDGPLPAVAALAVLRDVAAGLAAAHERGVVHGDFKTANVMLVRRRDGVRAVVTDFGLARTVEGRGDVTGLVAAGSVLGTPAYLAPEQVRGERPTSAADVYALGLVVCEMLTGRLPFEAETPLGVAVRRLTDPPTRPSLLREGLEPGWEHAILACLDRDPAARPGSPLAIVELVENGAAPPPRPLAAVVVAPSRPRRAVAPAALGLALAVALFGSWWVRSRSEPAAGSSDLAAAAVAARPVLAVFPFHSQGGDAATAWFSTAIAEALTSELARDASRLRLVAGESVARARLDLDLAALGSFSAETAQRLHRHLGSDLLVTGSFAVLGDTVRVDTRLHDTRGSSEPVAFAGEGRTTDLFQVVGRLAAAMRGHLGIDSAGEAGGGGFPTNPAAAQAYAEGLARLRTFDAGGAVPLLERAAELDAAGPLPRAALAEAWSQLGYETRAREAAAAARERGAALPQFQQLVLEALSAELAHAWVPALAARRSLWRQFPDDLDHGLRLAADLTESGQAAAALAVVAKLASRPPPAGLDPRIAIAEATAASALSDFARQRMAAERARRLGEELGAGLLVARAELLLASAARQLGEPEVAVAAANGARARFAAAGDHAGAARADTELGVTALQRGEQAAAEVLFRRAETSFRQLGDRRGEEMAATNLGLLAWSQGDLAAARMQFAAAATIAREVGSDRRLAGALSNQGIVAKAEDRLDDAIRAHRESLLIRRRIGDRQGEGISLNNLARVLEERGELAEARKRYTEALTLFAEVGDRRSAADAQLNAAVLARWHGDLAVALGQLETALAAKREIEDRGGEAAVRTAFGVTLLMVGQTARAGEEFAAAVAIENQLGAATGRQRPGLGRARLGLAEVALANGDPVGAIAAVGDEPGEVGALIDVRRLLVRALAAADLGMTEEARLALRRAGALAGSRPHWTVEPALLAARARIEATDRRAELAREAGRLRQRGLLVQAAELALARAQQTVLFGAAGEAATALVTVEREAQAMGYRQLAVVAAQRAAELGTTRNAVTP
jgi:TolB-like protein/tetratricopeptide (TPR) repeat protein